MYMYIYVCTHIYVCLCVSKLLSNSEISLKKYLTTHPILKSTVQQLTPLIEGSNLYYTLRLNLMSVNQVNDLDLFTQFKYDVQLQQPRHSITMNTTSTCMSSSGAETPGELVFIVPEFSPLAVRCRLLHKHVFF